MKFHGICNGLHIAIFDQQLDDILPKYQLIITRLIPFYTVYIYIYTHVYIYITIHIHVYPSTPRSILYAVRLNFDLSQVEQIVKLEILEQVGSMGGTQLDRWTYTGMG